MKSCGTIVMAVYRPDPELLGRQIVSLRRQTLRDWNCVVGIDGRDPATRRYVQEFTSGDDRFSIREFDENVGHYRNFERLLGEVLPDAPWFALSDQDDVWHPAKLEELTRALSSGADVRCALGQAEITDRFGESIGRTTRRYEGLPGLLVKNQITGSFLVGSPELLTTALPFPKENPSARHDHWLGVVAAATGRIVVLDLPLQDYVQHQRNVVGEVDPTRSLHARFRLVSPRGGLEELDRLSLEVWGWRVVMADAVLARVSTLCRDHRDALEAVAGGRLSVRLGRWLLRLVWIQSLRPRVAAGTAVAALWWPIARRRASGT